MRLRFYHLKGVWAVFWDEPKVLYLFLWEEISFYGMSRKCHSWARVGDKEVIARVDDPIIYISLQEAWRYDTDFPVMNADVTRTDPALTVTRTDPALTVTRTDPALTRNSACMP
jgi:hypothetical protein